MAMRRYDPAKTALKEGQWLCPVSTVADQKCGEPRQFVRQTKDRVFWTYRKGEGSSMKREILFVADTEMEADRMFRLELDRMHAVDAARKLVWTEFDARANALVEMEES